MKEFIYDSTFEGLLTVIFYAYPCKEKCIITKNKNYIPSLLNEIKEIKTETDKFNRVYNSIKNKLSINTLQNIYYLYLSEIQNCDTLILKYIKLCFSYGDKINLAKNNDIILLVDKYCRKVTLEAQRICGFVRFKEISPLTFYASIEPDHNILPLIMNHFTKRFSNQNFIIHDTKRNIAIIYNKELSIISDFSYEYYKKLISSNKSSEFELLWKTFYKAINISDRKNLKQRNGYMPKRYWKNLNELQ